MPAYNFKRQFAPLVKNGTKRTTIRVPRQRPTQVGETLHLYTGMRTKQCEKLGTYRCIGVEPIIIYSSFGGIARGREVVEWSDDLSIPEIEQLAAADGFPDAGKFFEFFRTTYGLEPLYMELITWEPL